MTSATSLPTFALLGLALTSPAWATPPIKLDAIASALVPTPVEETSAYIVRARSLSHAQRAVQAVGGQWHSPLKHLAMVGAKLTADEAAQLAAMAGVEVTPDWSVETSGKKDKKKKKAKDDQPVASENARNAEPRSLIHESLTQNEVGHTLLTPP